MRLVRCKNQLKVYSWDSEKKKLHEKHWKVLIVCEESNKNVIWYYKQSNMDPEILCQCCKSGDPPRDNQEFPQGRCQNIFHCVSF